MTKGRGDALKGVPDKFSSPFYFFISFCSA